MEGCLLPRILLHRAFLNLFFNLLVIEASTFQGISQFLHIDISAVADASQFVGNAESECANLGSVLDLLASFGLVFNFFADFGSRIGVALVEDFFVGV